MRRLRIRRGDQLVVKIGSALLTDSGTGLALELIDQLSAQIAGIRAIGARVVVVSSGAVAAGCAVLGLGERPRRLHRLQAAAAVGQVGLARAYEQALGRHNLTSALVLLTHDDLVNRNRYLNARSTLTTLLSMGVVPIVNENDTVATEEIRFGDNDTLAALVTNLLQASMLVILTDQQGLHAGDPRLNPQAPLLAEVALDDPRLDGYVGTTRGGFGRGGMLTKVQAAHSAAQSGAATIIASGSEPDVLSKIARGEPIGTLLHAKPGALAARKGWILSQRQVAGELQVDAGAERALRHQGVSLLPVGVTAVHGYFRRGDLVRVTSAQHAAVAQGLVNYSSAEVEALLGRSSSEIAGILGYCNEDELINRDNMVLVG